MGQKTHLGTHGHGLANEMVTKDPPLPGGRPQGGGDDAQEGTLAASIMSQHTNNFPGLDVETHSPECPPLAEAAGESTKSKDGILVTLIHSGDAG